ncbi:MAG: elongation factor G, partial [Acidobacteria bacterium]|nr:elongation factor G [Acidobacteriota bacterium]
MDILKFVANYIPSPVEIGSEKAKDSSGNEIEISKDPNSPVSIYVFKTISDPTQGRISVFKVMSGTLAVDSTLINARTGSQERMAGLFHQRGKERIKCETVPLGDIA